MRKPCATEKEAFTRFFTAPLYWLFCIVYFVVSFPKRMRRRRHFHSAPKKIHWRRLSESRVKALDATTLVMTLREKEQSDEFMMKKSPSIFELLEMLWEEELSSCWKLPMVSELESIREEIVADLNSGDVKPSQRERMIWAIDDERHVFVGYDPESGASIDAHPQFRDATVLHRRPPDSQSKYLVYAVSVMLRHDDA